MKEIILPSGRFAAIRQITWMDRAVCFDTHGEVMLMKLASRVVTIDGEALRMEAAAEMPLDDANPIIQAIIEQLLQALKSRGVA